MKNIVLVLIILFILTSFVYFYYFHNSNTIRENFSKNDNNKKTKLIDSDYTSYFIVLKSSKKRLDNINKILENNDFKNPHIFDAIKGNKQDRKKLYKDKKINYKAKKDMKPGALGCALSHIKIWELFLETKQPFALVCEDDIIIKSGFSKRLTNYVNNLPRDFDISILTNNRNTHKNKFNKSDKINKLVKRGYPEYGTVSYLISRTGAKKLLKITKPINNPIDDMILRAIERRQIISYKPITPIVDINYSIPSSIGYDIGKGGWLNL